MDWSGNLRPFVSRSSDNSFSFLYNNYVDHYPASGMEMTQTQHGMVAMMEKNNLNLDKKKRLTSDQLESLESSFQEDIKLDPDRKMKLAQELGMQPRQVAVWFQNRRARWKAKQLERLYDSLKQELDLVSREKQKLQEEVLALRAILKEEGTRKQGTSAGYTDISGEETVESTSMGIRSSSFRPWGMTNTNICGTDQCNNVYVSNACDDYNNIPVIPPSYWGTVMPSYP